MWSEKDKATEEALQGSWVELHFNPTEAQQGGGQTQTQSQSPCSVGSETLEKSQSPCAVERENLEKSQSPCSLERETLEKMLLDAQHESSRSTSKDSSLCSSPLRSQTPPQLSSRGSEGASSQSEEDYQERRVEVENLMKKNAAADGIWTWPSRPENNPPREFHLKRPRRAASLSIRNSSVMRRGGVLSDHFIKIFMPSLVLSHILALGLGIYIGRRLTTHSAY